MEDQLFKEPDMIEDMILRFPHLAEYVFKELAIKDLKTCLNVSRQWCHFMHNERFPWKRKIQSSNNICKVSANNVNLNKMMKNAPTIILKDFCLAIKKFSDHA